MAKTFPESSMVIRAISPNITTLSVPFLRFNKAKFGGRATIVKLPTGGLAVFSPVGLTNDAKSAVESMGGRVSYLIASDIEHHMNLGPWKQEYASATVIGPEGLYEKRKAQGNEDVPIDITYTKENKHSLKLPDELGSVFDVEYFDGHQNKELVFNYKPEKTMIQADLVFNLPCYEQFSKSGMDATSGIWTKIAHHFLNIHGKGQQRFHWYVSPANKPSFAESAKVVAGWEFDRIIPCHGEVIESGGNDVFRRIFAWNLKA
ncbi:hypothetical protein HOY82DRAFT_15871 [Tuber indicum]|nr:hypothetical protein HOY82DRAFT_15871 [Tuber indicum]